MSVPKPGATTVAHRPPAMAGMFYPDDPAACRAMARAYVEEAGPAPAGRWVGGIVPHAGWVCSGAIAGQTIAAIARGGARPTPDVIVVFGAVHSPAPIDAAALDTFGVWDLPSGEMRVHEELRQALAQSDLFRFDDRFHEREHAVEVEAPLVQVAWPGAAILPVEVPLIERAVEIGRETARVVRAAELSAVYLASSDMTHYGPAYGFAPAGVGPAGLEWAKANDRRLLELVCRLETGRVVEEVTGHMNACGGGAIAAMMAACASEGAAAGVVLNHANSCETLARTHPQAPTNAVGYAALVLG
ncbi:MAG: AmmeMemoRadiSam system protein B [Phycisphaerae bacterium]